ncbi:MAG: hypothetical protein EZS28_021749 [Streblomastix strix]|uniref:Uncharacterized protein n=1 Tax=Streblomastix strix TaxID=222440 RepID=A0A5J4VJU3_9EUKA|nr:MAG: hypothetical protein EZS28_021749 [Streblomastix strix]
MGKKKGEEQMRRSWRQMRERNKTIVVAAAVLVNKYKKNVLENETRQFRELMEMRTDWNMMNATSISIPATTIANIKDPEVKENQRQNRLELKIPISFLQYDSNTQTNINLDFNYISPQHNRPHKSLSLYSQQHSPSITLEEQLAVLRNISLRDSQEHKEKEPDQKEPSLQQYAGLMDVVERLHEIMELQVENEKKKSKIMLPGYCTKYPNKDYPAFFYPPKNYRLTPIR